MFKKIVLFSLLLVTTRIIHSSSSVTELVRSFINKIVGDINTSETFNKNAGWFTPTLENLNTITLSPVHVSDHNSNSVQLYSVSELAKAVDQTETFNNARLSIIGGRDNTQQQWNVSWGVDKIAQNEPVLVYSRGYAAAEKPSDATTRKNKGNGMCAIPKRGGGAIVVTQWLKNNIINGTTIVYDYPDTRDYFDFGLKNDQICLDFLHKKITSKTKTIVYFGNCRGAKSLLTFLSRSRPTDVKAVILDAPFLDMDQFTDEIGKNYARFIPFSNKLAKKVITKWYPRCLNQPELTLNELKQIPINIPIFIGHLKDDHLVSNQMIRDIVKTLRNSGHTVYLLVISDKTKSHSRLYQTVPFQKAVNAFLKTYNLPHDPILAVEGANLLAQAYDTAQQTEKRTNNEFLHIVSA